MREPARWEPTAFMATPTCRHGGERLAVRLYENRRGCYSPGTYWQGHATLLMNRLLNVTALLGSLFFVNEQNSRAIAIYRQRFVTLRSVALWPISLAP